MGKSRDCYRAVIHRAGRNVPRLESHWVDTEESSTIIFDAETVEEIQGWRNGNSPTSITKESGIRYLNEVKRGYEKRGLSVPKLITAITEEDFQRRLMRDDISRDSLGLSKDDSESWAPVLYGIANIFKERLAKKHGSR